MQSAKGQVPVAKNAFSFCKTVFVRRNGETSNKRGRGVSSGRGYSGCPVNFEAIILKRFPRRFPTTFPFTNFRFDDSFPSYRRKTRASRWRGIGATASLGKYGGRSKRAWSRCVLATMIGPRFPSNNSATRRPIANLQRKMLLEIVLGIARLVFQPLGHPVGGFRTCLCPGWSFVVCHR